MDNWKIVNIEHLLPRFNSEAERFSSKDVSTMKFEVLLKDLPTFRLA